MKQGSYMNIKMYTGVRTLADRFVNNNENFYMPAMQSGKGNFAKQIQFKNTKIGGKGLLILEDFLKTERVVCSNFAGYHYMINPTSTK